MTDEASVCTTMWFFIIFFCRHECNSFQKCCFVVVVKCECTLKATLHVPDSSGSRFAMISRSDHVMYQETMMAPPAVQTIQRADQEVNRLRSIVFDLTRYFIKSAVLIELIVYLNRSEYNSRQEPHLGDM